jgi:hypothetical protein
MGVALTGNVYSMRHWTVYRNGCAYMVISFFIRLLAAGKSHCRARMLYKQV